METSEQLKDEIRILRNIDFHETKIQKSESDECTLKLKHKIFQGTYVLSIELPERTISFESERNVVKNWKSVILDYTDELQEKLRKENDNVRS